MTEVVQLLVQSAGPEKAIICQAMVDSAETARGQTAVTLQTLTYTTIYRPCARFAFDGNPHLYSPVFGLHKGRCQALIPEVVSQPENFAATGHSMDTLFQKVAQAS